MAVVHFSEVGLEVIARMLAAECYFRCADCSLQNATIKMIFAGPKTKMNRRLSSRALSSAHHHDLPNSTPTNTNPTATTTRITIAGFAR